MFTFRIYTEDVNRDATLEIVSRSFDGFTVTEATGFWKREREASLVIEILADTDKTDLVHWTAEAIRTHNKQEAVLVTRTDTVSTMVTGED